MLSTSYNYRPVLLCKVRGATRAARPLCGLHARPVHGPQCGPVWRHDVRRPASPLVAAAAAAAAEAPQQPSAERWRPALAVALQTLLPDAPLLALTSVVLVGTIYTSLTFPRLIGELFDVVQAGAGAPPAAYDAALRSLFGHLAASAAGNCLVTALLAPLAAARFAARLRERLLRELVWRPQSFYDRTPPSDLAARLTLDVTILQAALADYLGQRGFRSLFEVLGAVGIIAWTSPALGVVSLAVTPLLSRALRGLVVRSAALSYEQQAAAAAALALAGGRLAAVQTVQVFGQEAREAAAYDAAVGGAYEVARRYALFQGAVESAGRLAVNLGTVALLGLGGALVLAGRVSVGTLLAVNVFNLFISVGLSSVAASLGELGKAAGALERIADLLPPGTPDGDAGASGDASAASGEAPGLAAASPAHGGGTSEAAPSQQQQQEGEEEGVEVVFDDVWFRYRDADSHPAAANLGGHVTQPTQRADWAAAGVSLRIPPGRTLALVGRSGGGKSTLAALALGLYAPQHGAVAVGGVSPAAAVQLEGGDGGGPRVAAVLQQPLLLSGSVEANIRFGAPDAPDEQIAAAAEAASAAGFIAELPAGYATQVGERGAALSGGQRQRLALARALAARPQFLVLDEVTSALDADSEAAVAAALGALRCTKLIIAHRLSTVRAADSIAVVEGGRVVERGSHEELMRLERGAYRALVESSELAGSSDEDEGAAAAAAAAAREEAIPV